MANFFKRFIQLRKFKKDKEDIDFQEKLWLQLKPIKLRENKIEQEKKEIENEKKKIKLPSWSKILLIFLFINFTILEIFIGWVTLQSFSLAFAIGMSPDLTPLVALIGAVIGQTISYWTYCNKSKAENTEGGVVHDTAMYELKYGWEQQQKEQDNDNNAVG
jgi:hypothetical protein